MEMQVRSILPRLRPQLLAKLIIPKSKHAAVGVLDNEDGARAEKASGDDQRAQRIVVAKPPALRMICASPVLSPRRFSTVSRASMQASTASFRAGGIGRCPSEKDSAWR